MNAETEEFRPRRSGCEIACGRINNLASDNREGPFNE